MLMLVAPQLHPSVEVRWREVIPNLLAYLKVRISLPPPPLAAAVFELVVIGC